MKIVTDHTKFIMCILCSILDNTLYFKCALLTILKANNTQFNDFQLENLNQKLFNFTKIP